jgi:hypothetical protein
MIWRENWSFFAGYGNGLAENYFAKMGKIVFP